MNILLINHYSGCPECGMEFRPYYMAKNWTGNGHKVLIVAATFSHLRKTNKQITGDFLYENIDGLDYLWIKTPEYNTNGLDRLKNILTFVRKLNKYSSDIVQKFKPHAVIASSTYPVDIAPAKKIAKKAKAKLIFEIHDLWPLSPMELGGYSKFHPFIAFLQYFENIAFKKSDAVVSILPKTLEHAKNHGLKPEKWHYVPNGIYLNDWKKSIPIPQNYAQKLDELKQKGLFLVGYTGNIGVANVLNFFIESKNYLGDKKIAVILLGTGTEVYNLKKLAIDFKHVYFFDPIEKTAIPNFLNKLDIVFVGLKRQPLFRFGVSPNKIFDYMMAKKPIIQAIEAGNDLVSDANAGITIEPENSEEIAKAILKFSQFSKNELNKMGENGQKFVLNNHEYSVLSDKFLQILQNA
ncbi:MAG: glycosyltransferase family 4 protein [Bacteroidales bacterium]|nr:glycosyltransferase family 4 protein [Bacteroidales bacterium]